MKDLEKLFSYSIANEIMPDLSSDARRDKASHFALILDFGETISKAEIEEIKKRTCLNPLFIDAFEGEERRSISSSYARRLRAPTVKPKSISELVATLTNTSFSVCENLNGAFFSFLANTPSYLNAGNEECRRFLGEICKYDIASEIVMPYTKNRTAVIRRPTVCEKDFYIAKNKFRAEISAKFKEILYY